MIRTGLAGLLALLLTTSAAEAAVLAIDTSSSFQTQTGGNFYLLSIAPVAAGPGFSVSWDGTTLSAPTDVFSTVRSTFVGFTPNAIPNGLYIVGQTTNQNSGAGSFSAGGGPGGGFGGFLSSGAQLWNQIGIAPLPLIFGSFVVPHAPVGAGGTSTFVAPISANAITAVVAGSGWTTGMVSISDPGTGGSDVPTTFTASGTNNLGANGGQLTLVTPFTVTILSNGNPSDVVVGIATLQLVLTPEPASVALLVAAALGGMAVARGRRGGR